ncbi:sterol desaturase family protein [Desertivirga arenae]|uniref:sterol desaturase family protein n=1 Tax=Desertivirga arenae TaxID=2810309 RepID=UPI001A95D886|nr:sterol desaturase family protein [Pedobacter sp. SYSU D00823]
MEYNYLAFGLPAFFLFVGLEYIAALRKNKKHLFKYDSSVANLSIGIAERLMNLFISGSFFELFNYIYEHHSLTHIPNVWYVWVLLLLATDFVWYWYHRLGHEINLLWGAHIVHHQSEEFNYTASARITTFQALIRNIFWCVLPFVGFHPSLVMTILVVHGAYSFFTHTQIIGKLGWFEYIFISPSLHGVHHASNEKYLNKNYGDLFVFWDKLFGTYMEEDEKPVYGLTHQLNSYSFMWQHFHYFMELAEACRRVDGIWNKLKIVFGSPEDLDQDIRPELERRFLPNKGTKELSARFKLYVSLQIVLSIALLFLITLLFKNLNLEDKVFGSLFIMVTLIYVGALLEQRKWIYYLEYVRFLILGGYLSSVFDTYGFLTAAVFVLFILNNTAPLKELYLRLIYQSEYGRFSLKKK